MSTWYPDWDFLVETHRDVLKKYGGHPGIEYYGESAFNTIIAEMKEIDEIYAKAAHLLKRLRIARCFKDAVKRSSAVICVTFLRMNGKDCAVKDPSKFYMFVKDILKYDQGEIVEWLKDGTTPEKS